MDAGVLPYAPTSILTSLPCQLPDCRFDPSEGFAEVGKGLVHSLHSLQNSYFTNLAIWRDLFALTGSIRTFYSPTSLVEAWSKTCASRKATDFRISEEPIVPVMLGPKIGWVNVSFTFTCRGLPATTCSGTLSIVRDYDDTWKIWVIRTILDGLSGGPNVDFLQLSPGSLNGTFKQDITINGDSQDSAVKAASGLQSTEYDCIVVGAGQAGLSAAGRLQALGISYAVLEKHASIGDNWITRYDSARLHTPRAFNHLPFDRTFSLPYQEYLTKYDLAKGFQSWASKFGIDGSIRLDTTLQTGSFDDQRRMWTLSVRYAGEIKTLTCRHLIMAVGVGAQIPFIPALPGRETFKGTALHSAEYQNPYPWKGKHGIVVGTANTAHDVVEDMLEAGLSRVTMIQRRKTYVLPVDHLKVVHGRLHNDELPTAIADREDLSMPLGVTRLIMRQVMHDMASKEPERFDALERAGFKVERYGDPSYHIYERLGGHYVDVGASAKIAKGLVNIKHAAPTSYNPAGLSFSDGSTLPADLVIFCTGFECSMHNILKQIFGPEVASRADDYWGLDDEGELKGAYKPNSHPNLWYVGGGTAQARYFSRFVALQIKADLMGTPLEVYGRKKGEANGVVGGERGKL